MKKRTDILERQVGEEHMLYDAAGRRVHVLNETARFVWALCDGRNGVEEMLAEAAKEYEAPANQLRADIEACLAELKELGLLTD